MKTNELKKLIKEAVKEVFHEEFKEIILEAIKKNGISQTSVFEEKKPISSTLSFDKSKISEVLGRTTIPSSGQGYNPPPVNTIAEGSKLPDGELDLSQIAGLLRK